MAGLRGDVTGTIKVAAFQSAVLSLLLPTIRQLGHTHPGCRVEVTELEPEVSIPALVAGDFDLVLGEEYPDHPLPLVPGVEREDLTVDPLELAVPAAWEQATTLTSIAARPFAMEPLGTTSRTWSTTLCRTAGFEPDVRYTSTDLQIHLRVVEEGLAAALLPGLAGARHHPGVTLRPLPGHPHRRVFTATRVGGREHPRVALVRNALKDTCTAAS